MFRSLELQEEDQKTWPQGDDLEKARKLSLFEDDHPSKSRFEIIGQQLYNAVFGSKEIQSLLDRLLHPESEIPVVEFHISDEGSILQAYPWELLHNGRGFLFDRKRTFPVRHVDFEEPVTPLELTGVLRVLYIAPRPDTSDYEDYASLPILERLNLELLRRYYPDHLVLESLPADTLDALHKYLMGSKNPIHVVHIDTHGGFGWLCQCKWLNPPSAAQCSKCNKSRSGDQKSQGHLAFETADGKVDWVSGDDLGKRLHERNLQVVVLSACRSGLVGGKSTFHSVAGALVKHRIPAVVAMQFSIEVKQGEKFAEFLYWALMSGMSLTEAVAEARIALSNDSWYRPVLYLRTDVSNYQGKVFEPKSPLGQPKKLTPRDRWIAKLGFKRDPFLYTDGGTDPYLDEYFYFGMRHFADIQGDVSKPGTVFVFGPPGSGKSSLRNVISQHCPKKDDILPIVYQDLEPVRVEGERVEVESHVTQILKTALRTLADRPKELGEKSTSSPETEESKTTIRNQLWLYVSHYEDDPLRKRNLRELLQPDPAATGDLPTDAREFLGRFCRYVTKLFGYQFVYILIDPDEDIAWQMLEPLLATRRLLELSEDKASFKFFLSRKFKGRTLQIPWVEHEQSRRVYDLEWPDDELRALLQERLKGCSGERSYETLEQISESVSGLDDRVIELSAGIPRELIAICDRLFSEHSRRWSPESPEPLQITAQEVDEVLKLFEERHQESAIQPLIDQGESERVEFKSTMRYNRKTHQSDKEMEREIARTMCAFMNTEGGILIIGVEDDGKVCGLEEDFSTLRKKNKDGFERAFANIVKDLFDPSVLHRYYRARFEPYQDKLIYVVEIERSDEPVFCLFDDTREFYIRELTTTRKLDVKEILEYCSGHSK